jgi:hypothetical protein
LQRAPKAARYIGAIICVFGGIYIGNGYGASYWRFGPFDLAWDTLFRGTLLIAIGLFLVAISK